MSNFSFLTPTIAGIAAAIAIPTLLILYFLKLRRRTIDVSSTLLWKKAVQDLQANAPFQRLRKNILLLLQLLALAAALFALAQPQFRDQGQIGVKRVILIDRSASMQATDGTGGKSRLDEAKERAINLVDGMREASVFRPGKSDEAMVISFDTSAAVAQNFTTDKAALKRAIESIQPSDAPSELGEAMRLARANLPRRILNDPTTGERMEVEGLTAGSFETHLFTDGRLPDASEVITQQADDGSGRHPVSYERVGTLDAVNVGITGFSAERDYDTPRNLSVFVGVQNTSRSPRTIELELLVDGAPERVSELTIPGATAPEGVTANIEGAAAAANTIATPGQTGVVFKLEREEGGLFAVRITPAPSSPSDEPPDALSVDNRAWLVVPPARRLAVAFVTGRGNLFMQSALEGLPLARLDGFTPDDFNAAIADGRAADYDVVVLDNVLPRRPDGEPGLPPGRFVIMGAAPPPPQGPNVTGEPGAAQFLDWARSHPAMRAVNLDNVVITEMPQLAVPEDSTLQVLAETGRGPGVLEFASANTRAIIVPFDVMQSNWPVEISFVLFTAASVRYLGLDAGAGQAQARSIKPGAVLTDRLPQGVQNVRLEPPQGARDGDTITLQPAPDGRIVHGPVRDVGVYRATWTGPSGPSDGVDGNRVVRAYAANLLDQGESDIPAAETLELAATQLQASAGTAQVNRRVWPWLLAAVLAVLMFEWWVYNRKVYL